jgi:hypothetical protein
VRVRGCDSWAAKFEGTEGGDATRAAASAIAESLNTPSSPRRRDGDSEIVYFIAGH